MSRKRSETFDAALAGYVKSGVNHREYAGECAQFALEHFKKHGDLVYADRFAEAMKETKTMRRTAFIKWMVGVAPCVMEKGKFKSDPKRGKFADIDLEAALEVPFWDYAPEEQIQDYGKDDVLKAFNNVIKRFSDETKANLDDRAKAVLTAIKTAVEEARRGPAAVQAAKQS